MNYIKKLMNHIKYAVSQYLFWLGIFGILTGIISILLDDKDCLAIGIVIASLILSFFIPLIGSLFKCNFKIKTVGKSNISFRFGNLFDEECYVITTNRYFDVNPSGEYICEDSVIGKFVKEYFPNNVAELENLINAEVSKMQSGSNGKPFDYGTWVRINFNNKIIYFLVFTDRIKTNQPNDFYERTLKSFLSTIVNENHGKIIGIPLLGHNNNLSDSGFSNSEISFNSLIAMINSFGIVNQRSELKIRIVALPEMRAELINLIRFYSK